MLCLVYTSECLGQGIYGSKLLDKAIRYHDPNDSLRSFKSDFIVIMELPSGDKRISQINIDRPSPTFKWTADKAGKNIEQIVVGDTCILKTDATAIISEKDRASHNISCERAKKRRTTKPISMAFLWN